MRKKWIGVLLILGLLAVLLLTQCGKKEPAEQTNAPAVGQTSPQDGETGPVKEQKLGTVTAAEGGGIRIETEENGTAVVYQFSDVAADAWYVDAVNFVATNGLMSGMDSGNGTMFFRPDHGMSRAQLAMVLYGFADAAPVKPLRALDDVSEGDWYYDCVNWAVANGYMLPSSDESFGAQEFCSCEETLTVLHRVAGSPASTMSLEEYPYAAKVSEEALVATRWAWEKGLIAEDECVWYPTQAVSRAQVALLLMRCDAIS